jgi:hypothetical protein
LRFASLAQTKSFSPTVYVACVLPRSGSLRKRLLLRRSAADVGLYAEPSTRDANHGALWWQAKPDMQSFDSNENVLASAHAAYGVV